MSIEQELLSKLDYEYVIDNFTNEKLEKNLLKESI